MASPMIDKFGGKKRKPKFMDEGPPSDAKDARGSGAGVDAEDDVVDNKDPYDASAPDSDMGPADPEDQAVDDLSDILGVGPEDRQDFGNALKAYVSSCIAKNLGNDMGPAADAGGPSMGASYGST